MNMNIEENNDNRSKHSLHLISQGKWNELHEFLSLQTTSENFLFDAQCPTCSKWHSLLHFACRFHPPLFIIKHLNEAFPDAVYEPDCKNQFPLHVAVENQASIDVQSYLIDRNAFAAKVPDINGRTPLHLVFCDYKQRRKSNLDGQLNQTLLQSVKLISDAAPMSVFSQDNHGMTALECAVSEHVGQKIQKELHKVESRIGSTSGVSIVKKRNSIRKGFDMALSKLDTNGITVAKKRHSLPNIDAVAPGLDGGCFIAAKKRNSLPYINKAVPNLETGIVAVAKRNFVQKKIDAVVSKFDTSDFVEKNINTIQKKIDVVVSKLTSQKGKKRAASAA